MIINLASLILLGLNVFFLWGIADVLCKWYENWKKVNNEPKE
jgi:hypothetical protein